ncbi:starch-binding protein [Paenibacillus graminis]|uniref:starch-binding protein n=1 Tax=Paenibacillus graminis TaxID=189425 RepID=UPI002DBF363A|nr:starch-binding protein [Paenibacillus graminis]MEC0172889.1 starch-binding protein [Paenibacillus graminis]
MKNKVRASLWSMVLVLAVLLQSMGFVAAPRDSALAADSAATAAPAGNYGLPAKTADGVIFHAWNWSFDTITRNLPALAAAGFKSVQTSPVQPTKEGGTDGSKWWLLYQPTHFSVGNSQLGSRDQFRTMCSEAEKYGISIIVDVVVNHTANAGGGGDTYKPAGNVDPYIRNNPSFWHEARGIANWDDRWQVTQWGVGLPDLNTSNQELQNVIIGFLNGAVSLGADGFRFDTAKHIELPDDPYGSGSNFWPRVLGSLNNKGNLYIYGEVLQGGADRFADYSNYINLAASNYGHNVRRAVGFGSSINVNSATSFDANNVNPSKLVTWVESHDTYANHSKETTGMNDWQIKMGWSIIAARAQTTSLFFNRPVGSGTIGQAGSTNWQDADIAAVNKFHNAMAGQGEYLRSQGNQVMLIERGNKGMTIVNLGGDTYINSATNLANGNYVNKASGGGTFTVSGGRITGNLGGGKIAVLYEGEPSQQTPSVTIDKAEGSFNTDSLAVRITVNGADSAFYTVNNGSAVSFRSGDTVTFGAGAAFGSSFVLKITAANGAGQTVKTYTFVKEDPKAALTVHYFKPNGWGTPNIYYYDDSVTPAKIGPAWPGTVMKDEGNGWYSYSITSWTQAKVIFNSGSNQNPAAQQPGYSVSGEKWIKDGVIYPKNPDKPTTDTFTVHYYKPSGWGTPNIYYYDDSAVPTKEGQAWPGKVMTSEGNGWYSYSISGWDKAYVIFNSDGRQSPESQQRGYLVTRDSWIKDGVITGQEP